ncbi:MAG TPA: hypothetical protein VKB89_04180 [Xanthobacteraceae bacterium]|nr:hypothetical protein [Xanthobacteraceae bacterium]
MHKPSRYFPTRMPTQTKPAPIGLDLLLKIGTALLISFAATLVLVHVGVFFASPLNMP